MMPDLRRRAIGSMRAAALVLPVILALTIIPSAQPKWEYGEMEQTMGTLGRPLEASEVQSEFPRDYETASELRGQDEAMAYRGRRERVSSSMEEPPRRSVAPPRKIVINEDSVATHGPQERTSQDLNAKVSAQRLPSLPSKIWNDFSGAAEDAFNGIRTGWRSISQGASFREDGMANRSLDSEVRSNTAVVEGHVLTDNRPVESVGGFAETRASTLRGDGDSKTESADSAVSSLIPGADGQLFGYSIWLWAAIGLGVAFCYLLCFIFKKQIPTLIRYIEICLCEYLIVALWQPFRFLFWLLKKCFYPTKEIVMLSYKKCDYYYHPYKIVCKG